MGLRIFCIFLVSIMAWPLLLAQNVGIGTLNPVNRLDIRDDGVVGAPQIVLGLVSDISNRPVLQFSEWESGLPGSGISLEYDGTDPVNPLHIRDVAGSRRFTFTGAGLMGIGVTSPNEMLEVGGSGRVFIGDGLGATRKGLLVAAVNGGDFVRLQPYNYSTASNMDLFIPGNVGIGVQDPQALLHVMGGQWNLQGGGYGDLKIGNADMGLSIGVALVGGGAGISRIYAKGGQAKLILGSDNTDVVVIDSANHVGIGTLNPVNRLDIRDDGVVGSPQIVLGLVSDISNRPVLQFSEWESGIAGSGISLEYDGSDPTNPLHIRDVAGSRRFTFTGAGLMGIGVTSPNEMFEVGGSGRVFIGDGLGATRKGLLVAAVNGGNFVRLQPYNYSTATNMDLYIPGNVGIGTSAPAAALQVLGVDNNGTNAVVKISNTPGTITHDMLLDGNEIDAVSTYLDLQGNTSGNLLMVRGGGNVGIGTIAPNAKLAVNGAVTISTPVPATGYALSVGGKIIAEEMRVQLVDDWPDYVFDDGYPLADLRDLENYIDVHNHLPGIPDAREIAIDGLLLGDMQRRMMEKIEELTLYIIEIHKRMDGLEAQNELLQSAIKSH